MSRAAKEGLLTDQGISPTAATVGSEVQYPPSGVQTYRAMIQTAMGGLIPVDVEAATGDQAAELALKQVPGGKVTNIAPAPNQSKRD